MTQLADLNSKYKENIKVRVSTRFKTSTIEMTNQSRPIKRKLIETNENCLSTPVNDESPEKKKPTTPVKFNYESKVVSETKLKINRTPVLKAFQPVQRISRRASQQLGLTPENLRQLLTRSPSPKKKIVPTPTNISRSNKENFTSATKFSPLSSTSLADLTTSPILNLPFQKRRRPSKD